MLDIPPLWIWLHVRRIVVPQHMWQCLQRVFYQRGWPLLRFQVVGQAKGVYV